MKIGDRIHSPLTGTTYTIYHTFKAGGQAEGGFATSDRSDKPYFVKVADKVLGQVTDERGVSCLREQP